VKKFLAFHEIRMRIAVFTAARHWTHPPTLVLYDPFLYYSPTYTHVSEMAFSLLVSPNKMLHAFFISSMRATCPPIGHSFHDPTDVHL
jgi:hypothetical protein